MPSIDLVFPVIGSRLPTDHSYPLYSSISHLLPALHQKEVDFALSPITGSYAGSGQLLLDPRSSRLRVRIKIEHISQVLPLAGKQLRVMGQKIQLGAPTIHALSPSSSLIAHAVTIKHATEEEAFLVAARKKLDELQIAGRLELPRIPVGAHQGETRRQVMRIKDAAVICFALLVHDLGCEESIRLQEVGLGGRRRMGAGVFVRATEAES
jgi:CRISPR-associated protein Cas6